MLKWYVSSNTYAYGLFSSVPIEMQCVRSEMLSFYCFFCTISLLIIEEITKIVLVTEKSLDSVNIFLR